MVFTLTYEKKNTWGPPFDTSKHAAFFNMYVRQISLLNTNQLKYILNK